eukprot:RCo000083
MGLLLPRTTIITLRVAAEGQGIHPQRWGRVSLSAHTICRSPRPGIRGFPHLTHPIFRRTSHQCSSSLTAASCSLPEPAPHLTRTLSKSSTTAPHTLTVPTPFRFTLPCPITPIHPALGVQNQGFPFLAIPLRSWPRRLMLQTTRALVGACQLILPP